MTTARLTADAIVFTRNSFGQRCVLVIERKYEPYRGQFAFPGGHLDDGETPKDAAHRELTEETGLNVDELPTVTAADDAATARWVPLRTLRNSELAFDHGQILDDALDAIG